MRAPLVLACALAAGCGGGAKSYPVNPVPSNPLVTARPYQQDVPDGWHNETALPLIVLLHGYGATGFAQEAFFGFNHLPNDHQVLVAYPDGTRDSTGAHFWNADDACCDFGNTGVDDVAYLNAVVDDMEVNFNVDKSRVYFAGHSNGAFMAHRMACDSAGRIAAIMAFAGDVWKDASKCNPAKPVPVLQIHGTADDMVPYDGSDKEPSAVESVATWAAKDGCTGGLQPTGKPAFDIAKDVPGDETQSQAWMCPPGGAAELWTMMGGGHEPQLVMDSDKPGAAFSDLVWAWLSPFKR